jgi:hypothetical protein
MMKRNIKKHFTNYEYYICDYDVQNVNISFNDYYKGDPHDEFN